MNTSKKDIVKYAAANALLTALYIVLIALFFSNAQTIFGDGKSILIPIAMLMLFVFSAAVCAALILGRPILWYLDNRKSEALQLFGYTLAVFFVVILVVFSALYMV